MSGDTLTEQIRNELSRIMPVVSELTGLSSNWNGQVDLVEGASYRGVKKFECGIHIRASLARDEVRWRTLIHESLHAVSVGFNRLDFQANVGWEEGVVEQLQRLLRREILAALSAEVSESVFLSIENALRYNIYIDALERLRESLAISDQRRYYVDLLSIPVGKRLGHCLNLGMQLLGSSERRRFLDVFSASNRVLTEGGKMDVNF